MSTTERFWDLPYHIEILRSVAEDGDSGWVAEVTEWPGCIAQGRTMQELEVHLREAMEAWVEAETEDGRDVPPPRGESSYSGQFRVRLPVGLHMALAREAERQGVSLNTLVATTLAGALGWRAA